MYRLLIGTCVLAAAVGGGAMMASAQNGAVPCDQCETRIEITPSKWKCMKPMVLNVEKAASNPFRFPITGDKCDGSLGNPRYDYPTAPDPEGNPTYDYPVVSWQYMRVSEAKCVKSLGSAIDTKLKAGGRVVVDVAACKLS